MIYSFRNSGFRDPETGVYNQTYFMEVFHREWHRHMREHQSLALLYLCPHIHETVKQPHLLEFFTKQVQEALLRATDLLARMDHNHFALGLFNIDEDGTEVVLKRIEEQIGEFNREIAQNHKLKIDYKLAGCICLPTNAHRIESLFANVSQLSLELERNQQQTKALIHLQ
ncbi:diguanylate cyclase [Shewanella sp. A25]|nr:diguanylate cyclase [Shewanella shenzhenensis]